MTSRKSQNSVLFLATLGVYLGLVLTGATPVLGHAATARQFDIRDEIEFSDELDNNPDSDAAIEQFASTFLGIYSVASELSVGYPEQVANSEYNFNLYVTVGPNGGSWGFSPGIYNTGLRKYSGRYTQPLNRLYDTFLPRADKQHEKFRVDFELTSDEVIFRATVSQDIPDVAAFASKPYVESLSRRREIESDVLRSLIYSTTEVSFADNQVIIVTRLPRGSIDPLLAKDAK